VSEDRGGATAIVLSGGGPVDAGVAGPLPVGALVVAADSGLHLAAGLGLRADLVVGDLDSVDPRVLAAAEAEGAAVRRFPAAKDQTDLQLALDAAVAAGSTRLVVLGGGGGRLDHLLAGILLLAAPVYAGLEIHACFGRARVHVVRERPVHLHGQPGSLVSLLPAGGPARGVHTTGLRWHLRGDDLEAGASRGVSNELVGRDATVRVTGGVLLAVQPAGGTA